MRDLSEMFLKKTYRLKNYFKFYKIGNFTILIEKNDATNKKGSKYS